MAQSLVCFSGGWVTDWIIGKGVLRTITIRKINTAFGLLVPAITVVLAGYMGYTQLCGYAHVRLVFHEVNL